MPFCAEDESFKFIGHSLLLKFKDVHVNQARVKLHF